MSKKYKGLIECSNEYFYNFIEAETATKYITNSAAAPATAGAEEKPTPTPAATTQNSAPPAPAAATPPAPASATATSNQASATATATPPSNNQQSAGLVTNNGMSAGTASSELAGDGVSGTDGSIDNTANVVTGNAEPTTPGLGAQTPTTDAGNQQSLAGDAGVQPGGAAVSNPSGAGLGNETLSQGSKEFNSEIPETTNPNGEVTTGDLKGTYGPNESTILLLSKLLPTESELKRMNNAELIMLKNFIFRSGISESMFQESETLGYTKIISAYNSIAKDVLSDPANAINIVKAVPKMFEKVNTSLLLIKTLADNASDNLHKKISNQTISSVLSALPQTIKSGIDSMQSMIKENIDWISTVMSKPLNQWNIAFADTSIKNWKCAELFILSAICCSVVFTCSKIMSNLDNENLAVNTVENNIQKIKLIKSALKESRAVFGGIRNLIETDMPVDSKLSKYADGKIPTNVILINSMILKAGKPAKDLLSKVISEKPADTTVDKSVMINKPFYTLCTLASAFVLLWIKIAGMYIKNSNDINIVSNMMSDKIRSKIDPSEPNVLKSLFGGLQTKLN